jgi:hypothetical protein
MKHLLLFCATIFLCVAVHAQAAKSSVNKTGNPMPPVMLKVSLSGDKFLIVYKDQEIPAANVQVLDSLIKSVPDPKSLNIEYDANDGDDSKNQAINAVLKKCQCPVLRRSLRKSPVH